MPQTDGWTDGQAPQRRWTFLSMWSKGRNRKKNTKSEVDRYVKRLRSQQVPRFCGEKMNAGGGEPIQRHYKSLREEPPPAPPNPHPLHPPRPQRSSGTADGRASGLMGKANVGAGSSCVSKASGSD